ncbi:MAG: hypothetical protein ACRDOY_11655 [Nocardioidaceae bacterium]
MSLTADQLTRRSDGAACAERAAGNPATVLGASWLIATACALAVASGCSQANSAASSPPQPTDLPDHSEPVALNPAEFSADIDNKYWPMKPGTRWIYKETTETGEQVRVVVTATSVTKEIANGITARVVRDTVTEDGKLVEDTVDWYAQDSEGNIWYLGEKTAEFEQGKLASREGSFEAGVDGAMAGVIMPSDPADGMKYRQEYYQGKAEDNGEVLSTDEMAAVPAGYYGNALLTQDTNTIEPHILEYKLYAPNVGPVLVLGVSGGATREQLVETRDVSAEAARSAGTTRLGDPYE